MELGNRRAYEFNREAFGFAIAVMIGWIEILLARRSGPIAGWDLLWATTSGIAGWWVLASMDYFRLWRPIPRLIDFALLVLVLPLPALAMKYLLWGLTGGNLLHYRYILLGSPWPAIHAYVFQLIWARYRLHEGGRHGLLPILLPEERSELLWELRRLRLSEFLQPIDLNKLKDRGHKANLIVISQNAARDLQLHHELIGAHLQGQQIVDNRQLLSDLRGRIALDGIDLWSFVLGATPQTFLRRMYFSVKFLLEPLVALMLLILLAPLLAALTIAIRLSSPGPAFYRQCRTGFQGRTFQMVKFRSMRQDAETAHPIWAGDNDARITPLGKFLRATRLDELPQLWNIFRGEMSFVGPRPERPEFYRLLSEQIPLFFLRTLVRPGVTGWAQVNSGYAASVAESRLKLEYDLYYIRHMSPRLDAMVIFRTIAVVLKRAERSKDLLDPSFATAGDSRREIA